MTTINDLATELAEKYGDSHDDALRAVTTYAVQIGHPAPMIEGGQAPDVTVDPETADHIVRAYELARGE